MPVGTTADFNLTREELLELSLSICGVNEPSEDDLVLSRRTLGSFIRHLDLEGHWFWAIDQTESSLTLVSGQAEYVTGAAATNIKTNIFRLQWVAKIEANEDRIPLTIFTEPAASRTFLKGDTDSEPVAVFLDRAVLLADNVLRVYPTPNQAYELRYTFRRPIFDFDSGSDNPDIPSEAFLALQYGLAYHLAPHFGVSLNDRVTFKAEFTQLMRDVTMYKPNKSTPQVARAEYY